MVDRVPVDEEMADVDFQRHGHQPREGEDPLRTLQRQVEQLLNARMADRADLIENRNRLNNMHADLVNAQQELQEAQRELTEIQHGPQALADALTGIFLGRAGHGAAPGGVHGGAAPVAQGLVPAPVLGGAAGFHRVKALPRFSFEGKADEDWLSFRDMFRNYARFGGYTDAEAKSALNLCMRGTAQRAVSAIDPTDATLTLDAMLRLYEAKFLPASASAMAKSQYEEARQGPKEPILTYHGRLQTLLLRAYPRMNNDEPIVVNKFMTGLFSKPVRLQVLRRDPQTYDDALQAAQAEQAVLDQGRVNPMTDMTSAGDGRGQARTMEINAMDVATAICHNCQKVGHLQRDCRHPKRERPKGDAVPRRSGSRSGKPADRSRSKSVPRKADQKKTWSNHQRRLADQNDPGDGAESAEEEDAAAGPGKPVEEPEDSEGADSADSEEPDF